MAPAEAIDERDEQSTATDLSREEQDGRPVGRCPQDQIGARNVMFFEQLAAAHGASNTFPRHRNGKSHAAN